MQLQIIENIAEVIPNPRQSEDVTDKSGQILPEVKSLLAYRKLIRNRMTEPSKTLSAHHKKRLNGMRFNTP